MAEITAALVKQLRDKMGAGMGECKKALVEADGDLEKAIEIIRTKNPKASQSERAAGEGAVAFELSDDKKRLAVVELRCETDFAARNDNFQRLLKTTADCVLRDKVEDAAAAKEIKEVKDGLQEAAAVTIRENIVLAYAAHRELEGDGAIGTYVHHNGSVGSAVAVSAPAAQAGQLDDLLRDLAMHVTAHDPVPVAVDKDGIPKDLVERERKIYLAAIEEDEKDRNKPDNIKEKMVDGKLRRFFEERALLEQKFVKNPELTVRKLLEEKGKELGGTLSVAWFERRAVGS